MNTKDILRYVEDSYLSNIGIKLEYPKSRLIYDNVTDTEGYMVKNGKTLIICFRGTDNKKDWLTNLDYLYKNYAYNSDISVHTGFYRAYRSVREQIHDYIKEICPEDIITCGHSLGGALANLAALDIQYNFDHGVKCYTFGAPRVGNNKFKKSYNKRVPDTIRTYIYTDPVPHLPPFFIGMLGEGGYRHVGKKNKLGPSGFFSGMKNWLVGLLTATKGLGDDLVTHSVILYKKYI